jgi:prepilin-type N-terminal cleavage/methylation domain-containing protein
MESHNICSHAKKQSKNGFTLIEILVVVGIIGLILSMGLITSFDSYRGYTFRSERAVLVSTLEKARSRAMANMFETVHGVCYIAPNYIIFRGPDCIPGSSTNEIISGNSAVSVAGLSDTDTVVFEQLSGNLIPELPFPTDEIQITVTQDNRTSIIKINNEGTINW